MPVDTPSNGATTEEFDVRPYEDFTGAGKYQDAQSAWDAGFRPVSGLPGNLTKAQRKAVNKYCWEVLKINFIKCGPYTIAF